MDDAPVTTDDGAPAQQRLADASPRDPSRDLRDLVVRALDDVGIPRSGMLSAGSAVARRPGTA